MISGLSNAQERRRFMEPKFVPKDYEGLPTSGTPVEVFLKSGLADRNRVDGQAPYPASLDGVDQLGIHRLVVKVAEDALRFQASLGAGSPLTMAGLAVALNRVADRTEAEAAEQKAKASEMESDKLGRLTGAVKAAALAGARGALWGAGASSLILGAGISAAILGQTASGIAGEAAVVGLGLPVVSGLLTGFVQAGDAWSHAYGKQEILNLQENSRRTALQGQHQKELAGYIGQWEISPR